MKAAIYARYSSENQRPESIEDQIASCRRLATQKGYVVSEDLIYSDIAASGARKDRAGLSALLAAAEEALFSVVLVDDLSRLARDNFLMLSLLAELRFRGIRIVSVADGLDSEDEESALGIQVRGIFNELQLRDLRKKTLRGQAGQKARGFFVGERTYGYRSVPAGAIRMDKKGRPRPDGYAMVVDPREAAIVVRVFEEFASGVSQSGIVRWLNQENIPGRQNRSKAWAPATIFRMLRSTKYIGRWVWNATETRRDPKTGRRRQFPKPESEWCIVEDPSLRIVSDELWGRVQERLKAVHKTWPGGEGKSAFAGQGSRCQAFPTQLLAGSLVCGTCGGAVVKVTNKGGGYYGCRAATRAVCENRLIVRRSLTERVILDAVRERLATPESLEYLLRRVEHEVAALYSSVPESLQLKRTDLESEQRRVANFVEFIGEGRGSRALADALLVSERRVEELRVEIEGLERSQDKSFRTPPLPWIIERVACLQAVLESKTPQSALVLRKLLGPIRLEPTQGDIGRPYYRAVSKLHVMALLEDLPGEEYNASTEQTTPEGGSTSFRWWRRRELNPRPEIRLREALQA